MATAKKLHHYTKAWIWLTNINCFSGVTTVRSPGIHIIRWRIKPLLHLLFLVPLCLLVWGFVSGDLGANPIEVLTHETGELALIILLICLCVTPLVRLTHSGWLVNFRRLIGLYSFFYALLHFVIYLLFDLSLDFTFLWQDILDRPYITVGFSAFTLLLLLALTSTGRLRRGMGIWWSRLHKLVYLATALAVLHFLWVTKADNTEPFIYGLTFVILMAYRGLRNRSWFRWRQSAEMNS